MSSDSRLHEFDELVAALCDGRLDAAAAARLDELLRAEPALCQRYLKHMAIHAGLAWDLAGRDSQIDVGCKPAQRHGRLRGRRTVLLSVAVAAVAIAAVVSVFALRQRADNSHRAEPAPLAAATLGELAGEVEVVSPAGDARAAQPGQDLAIGDMIRTGEDDAVANMTCPDGTQLELGPETILRFAKDIAGGRRLIFTSGTMQVDAVPQPAERPLIVATPYAELRVRGTRFTICAPEPEETRVDLAEGRLDLVRLADGRVAEMEGGSYAVVGPGVEQLSVKPLRRPVTRPLRELSRKKSGVVFPSSDATQWIVATNRQITLYSAEGGERSFAGIRQHPAKGNPVAAADGSTLALFDHRGRVTLWDPAERRVSRRLAAGAAETRLAVLAPRGDWLAGEDAREEAGTIKRWDVTDGALRWSASLGARRANCLAVSVDGQLLAVGVDGPHGAGRIALHRAADGVPLTAITCDFRGLNRLAFSPEGQLLAAAGRDGAVRLWQIEDWKPLRTIPGHKRALRSLVFSPDGRTLAAGTVDGQVWLWDIRNGGERMVIRAGKGIISSLAFSRDGRVLAAASNGNLLALWDVSIATD